MSIGDLKPDFNVSRALIIDDPWIGYILDGSKTWEMRSTGSSHRGWFGLIRKGSGHVHGVARLVEVGEPLSPPEMVATFERHRIGKDRIWSGEIAKWNTPWKLADVHRLNVPVPYRHKRGAVVWVSLDQATSDAVEGQISWAMPLIRKPTSQHQRSAVLDHQAMSVVETLPAAPRSAAVQSESDRASTPAPNRPIGVVEINGANIQNSHFYLRPLVSEFPDETIGGSNKSMAAKKSVILDWGGPVPADTDIDGDKKFFRARAWVRSFYQLNHAKPGDAVVIVQTGPYRYRVRLQKRC